LTPRGRSSGTDRPFVISVVITGLAAVLAVFVPLVARADVGPPAHMQVTETSPGLYSVQWRVPKALPVRAVPTPKLPETCRPAGERTVVDQPGAWLLSRDWRCEGGLAGHELGILYPFADLSLTTVVRVDLLSGDRFAHVLSPGEGAWRVPEGTAPPDPVLGAQRAVLSGAAHAAGSWIHVAFVLVLAILGGFSLPIRLVTLFTGGQLAAVALAAALGARLPGGPAEIGLALGVVLLAREAVRPAGQRRSLGSLAAAAGLVHGLGLATLLAEDLGVEAGLGSQVVAVLGMDAVHIVGVGLFAFVLGRVARRLPGSPMPGRMAYAVGIAGMAFAFSVAAAGQGTNAPAAGADSIPGQEAVAGTTGGAAASQRLTPSAPDATVQSFLAVEPFEVRHEVMLRVGGLAATLGLGAEPVLEIERQGPVTDSLVRMVLGSTTVVVDGATVGPSLRRADFMTVDPTGALPRTNPVLEDVATAVVGVVVAYPTPGMPEEVRLAWDPVPETVTALPATVIDPENTMSAMLSQSASSITWDNALIEDPIPSVAAIAVEPARIPIPWLSLPLIALAGLLLVRGLRVDRQGPSIAAARIALAAALVVGPVVQSALAVPGSAGRVPSERQARRILSGLLPNVYRALEYRQEEAIYDRLAVSVTGETLTEVYLEQRRALEMEERGGAQARVETVEVQQATDIERSDGGFSVRGQWTVGGMVTHFGHRHFRQNRYDARVGVVPVEGTWKIRSIEVLEQERLR
jgi:hypothetical protein